MASSGRPRTRRGTQTLGETANATLLEQLSRSIEEQTAAATFALGGTIPISGSVDHSDSIAQTQHPGVPSSPSNKTEELGSNIHTSPPVTLRWDSYVDSNLISKLVFPLEAATSANLEQLVKDCQPATFGYKGKDVYNEDYRKASKLDPLAFSSTFNPYELGIIDAIAQVLLPSVKESSEMRGVRAELYKLNIYSGPSGKFQAHVDTPRSDSQFGSLVVCLPCNHEGGELIVRHQSKVLTFDWSTSASDQSAAASIKWAAFYSDCEHEVLEVRTGHRITLTYNLYVSRGSGDLAGHCPWIDPQQLPLYDTIIGMLQVPSFMRNGKTADSPSNHSTAANQLGPADYLVRALLTLAAGGLLGIWCSHAYAHSNSSAIKYLPSGLKGVDMAMYEIFRALGLEVTLLPVLEADGDDEDYTTFNRHGTSKKKEQRKDFIGTSLHPLAFTSESTEWTTMKEIYNRWGDLKRRNVTWLSKIRHREPAVAFLAYGNEASMEVTYSSAALIVKIPTFKERDV